MSISPTVAGSIAIGAVSATAAAGTSHMVTSRHMKSNPTGSSGDRVAMITNGAIGLAGFGAFAAGIMGGNSALLAAGAGLATGAIGGHALFTRSHGTGTEAALKGVFAHYDHNRNGQLDLDRRWGMPENVRVTEHPHEDSDGDVHYDRNWYNIYNFTSSADTDENRVVTKTEARTLIERYDADGDKRLKGAELRSFDREVGERQMNYFDWHI